MWVTTFASRSIRKDLVWLKQVLIGSYRLGGVQISRTFISNSSGVLLGISSLIIVVLEGRSWILGVISLGLSLVGGPTRFVYWFFSVDRILLWCGC